MSARFGPEGLEISTDRSRLDLDVICDFLSQSYWAAGRPRAKIERAIAHSMCFGAYFDGQQVGFARVVSDHAVFAYLADVFVLPEFRGRGISKAIVAEVLAHRDLQGLRLFLLRTRDAHGLYTRFGFGPLPRPEETLAILDPESDRTPRDG